MKHLIKKFSVSLALLMMLGVYGCQSQSKKVEHVNADAFESKMNTSKDYILLDVRTAPEFNQAHLPGAQLIDYYQKNFKQELTKLDKNKPVFVYCTVGSRSSSAASILLDMGFTEVYNLQGGIYHWAESKKPLEK